ncbi:hypothetical protein JL721_9334 [Aureococcus anophagefferens]|nr:hypothetical protein JL721_9334 [Aureococcus anophagefferens]
MKDSPKFMMAGDTLRGSQETAARSPVTFARLKAKQPSSRVVFLRHPLQLVYSQFLYCKYVLKRKMPGFPRGRGDEGEAGGLDAWADHVSGGRDAYKCYHPRDVQFRFVVGAGDARAPEGVPANVGAAAARRALDADFSMVGVVEAYRESLCLFRWLGDRRTPPAYCGCGATAAFPSWRNFKNKSRVARLAKRCTTGAAALGGRRLDWLNVDAEGHELAILQGTLPNVTVDVVSVEANDGAVGAYLRARGYALAKRFRGARGHFDDFYTRPGFALLAPAAWRDERCAAPGEDTALSPSAPRRCGVTRLLRCSLKNPAGFGFRVAVLNGCLRAATLLNATLLFDRHTFYRTRAGYGIDERTSDGLLWLDAVLDGALPNGTALERLRAAGCLEPDGFEMALPGPARRGGVEAWWAAHGAAIARDLRDSPAAVVSVRAANSNRREGDAPFASHDFSATAAFFRAALLRAAAVRPAPAHALGRFRGGFANVAVHLLRNASATLLHVVLFGASVTQPDERGHDFLRDAAGAASTLPAYAASRFPSSAVVIDNDAFNDLAHFAFADVFVAAWSQFSYAALALSRGVALRPADFRGRSPVRFDAAHAAACHVAVDGAAASARLAAALADLRAEPPRNKIERLTCTSY